MHVRDVPDAADFRLVDVRRPPPDWALDAVVYQIFPDRFADRSQDRSRVAGLGRARRLGRPGRRQPRTARWRASSTAATSTASPRTWTTSSRLGVDVVYLTPFFPARSNHRYDASSFDTVDPLLGGDEALRRLVEAAHERGLQVMGDFTTNHTGDGPRVVPERGPGDPDSDERDYYLYEDGTLRRLARGPVAAQAQPPQRGAAPTHLRATRGGVVRQWLGRPAASTAGGSTSRT